MLEIECFAFHPTKPTIKKVMTHKEFLKLKPKNGYVYRAYELNYNLSIININNVLYNSNTLI